MRNTTRSLSSDNDLKFDHSKPRLEICQQSFYRTCALVNRLPQSLQFGNAAGLKSRLLNFLWHHFETSYNELVSDSGKFNSNHGQRKGTRSPRPTTSKGQIPTTTTKWAQQCEAKVGISCYHHHFSVFV